VCLVVFSACTNVVFPWLAKKMIMVSDLVSPSSVSFILKLSHYFLYEHHLLGLLQQETGESFHFPRLYSSSFCVGTRDHINSHLQLGTLALNSHNVAMK